MTCEAPTVVVYHDNCADGFCAAWLIRANVSQKVRWVPATYGDGPPVVSEEDVLWVVDFSYPRDVLEELNRKCKGVVVLDHHKTAREQLEGLDFCYFDMSKSGARLTFEHLRRCGLLTRHADYAENETPLLVAYTEDRDLWKWELPYSREINAALRTYPLDFDVWDKLDEQASLDHLIVEGRAIVREVRLLSAAAVEKGRRLRVNGHTVLVVNSCLLASDIASEAKDVDVVLVWHQRSDGKYHYEFRSKSDLDVSEVAKRLGGGGHRRAAGAITTTRPEDIPWKSFPITTSTT